jgi:hypothetical protein
MAAMCFRRLRVESVVVATPPDWALTMSWLMAEQFHLLSQRIDRLGRKMSEVQDAVDAIVVQLGKAKDEILAEIANLEAQIAAGEAPDLTALKAAAQSLDDVVPDAPVEPPVA